jgi:hypothetical protein
LLFNQKSSILPRLPSEYSDLLYGQHGLRRFGRDNISLDNAYAVSEDVVAREIEGEIIIVPLVAGIGDMEYELYTLNETGKAVWARLDAERS